MKILLFIPLLLVVFCAQALPVKASSGGCEAKEEAIERQIEIAKTYGNLPRVAGLEQALDNVRRYCTDDSLRGKAEMKLSEKRQEVLEREADLEEARAKGDKKKIAKRERKLNEAREEVAEAERELADLIK